jgi:hypothetical protein
MRGDLIGKAYLREKQQTKRIEEVFFSGENMQRNEQEAAAT